MAKNSGTKSTKTTFRFVQDERTNTAPISGTYTVKGGIKDRGTSSGTILPVVKKVRRTGPESSAIDTTMTQKGAQGSFVVKCRDTHFVQAKDGHVTKATGRCVFSSTSGAYSRLDPGGVHGHPAHPPAARATPTPCGPSRRAPAPADGGSGPGSVGAKLLETMTRPSPRRVIVRRYLLVFLVVVGGRC